MGSIGAPELILILAVVLLFPLIIPALLRWLWNTTMPEVFGLKQITFWQAFRLLIIAFILFGVWGAGGG
ncbi:MAG: hypothetical protein BMS9Abin05_2367 [Rhodothermia bacterium]|nr:MAG: hypothetical protein BMS9Abin05_2367 [Rhodothermia bacterium]